MIDFIRLRRWFALLSLAILIPCLIALALWQLNPGIDFQGGLELEVRFLRERSVDDIDRALADAEFTGAQVVTTREETFALTIPVPAETDPGQFEQDVTAALVDRLGTIEQPEVDAGEDLLEMEIWFPADVAQEDVRDALQAIDLGDARVQATGESAFKIRAQEPDDGTIETLRQVIIASLEGEVGPLFVLQAASVSGVLSAEIARDAGIALAVAAVAILIYVSLAFRRLPSPALYGTAAIIALLHDITIVVGVFAILGEVVDMEVNAMFVTGLLAIIGYSVNDTIIVFDRIRETFLADPGADLRFASNAAITQTLGRSLNTSITLVLALLALVLIGGVTVRPFVLVLLVGAVAGTYSSIGVAAQVVIVWDETLRPRLFGETPQRGRRARASAS